MRVYRKILIDQKSLHIRGVKLSKELVNVNFRNDHKRGLKHSKEEHVFNVLNPNFLFFLL